MAKISSIKPQQRNPQRISISLDGRFWLGCTQQQLLELDLRPGRELDQQEQKIIAAQIAENEAYQFCLRSLGYRARSQAQLQRRLSERDFDPAHAQLALQRCIEAGLIDDNNFAELIVEEELLKGHGRRRAEQRLREAGVDSNDYQPVLDARYLDEEEEQRALTALQRRFSQRLGQRDRQRAQAYLARRGYSQSSIQAAIAERAMSASDEEEILTESSASEVLRAKYRNPDWGDHGLQRRAFAFLSRRGYSSGVIQRALSDLRSKQDADEYDEES